MKNFHEYFRAYYYIFSVLHETHCNNSRVTEILVVISGDFFLNLTFSFTTRHKLPNFIKWEIIIMWISRICYVYNMLYVTHTIRIIQTILFCNDAKKKWTFCIHLRAISYGFSLLFRRPNKLNFKFGFYIKLIKSAFEVHAIIGRFLNKQRGF